MIPEFFEFYLPTRIISGAGLAGELGPELEKTGLSRGLVVTDPMMLKSGLVDRVLRGLQDSAVRVADVFSEVVPNSDIDIVERGAALAREVQPESWPWAGAASSTRPRGSTSSIARAVACWTTRA